MAQNSGVRQSIKFNTLLKEKIGIIYCTSKENTPGREIESLADCEVIEVAHAVQSALWENGYPSELVDLNPDELEQLDRFDWIFNLAESVDGFPLCDYEVVEQLENRNFLFTGAGSNTIRQCGDKALTKLDLIQNGIVTPAFEVFRPGQPIVNKLPYPLFVKPIHEDGSIGISQESVVCNDFELNRQVTLVHDLYRQDALVEQFIDGRDISASILGNGSEAIVLPLSEIVYDNPSGPNFLTYDAKWVEDSREYLGSKRRCPCQLPVETEAMIKEIALRASFAMGCRDYARVDFRLSGRVPYVLEVNPNPCINPHDTAFVSAGLAAGISFPDLVMIILLSALKDRLSVFRNRLFR